MFQFVDPHPSPRFFTASSKQSQIDIDTSALYISRGSASVRFNCLTTWNSVSNRTLQTSRHHYFGRQLVEWKESCNVRPKIPYVQIYLSENLSMTET